MANKTKKSYLDVFSFIKKNFTTLANIEKVITDYEIGLRNALREVYEGIKVQGCYFHYTQVIVRKSVKKLLNKTGNLNNLTI